LTRLYESWTITQKTRKPKFRTGAGAGVCSAGIPHDSRGHGDIAIKLPADGNHRNGNKSAAIPRSRSDDCLSLNAHLAVRLLFNKRRTMLEHAIDNGRSVCPFVTLIIHAYTLFTTSKRISQPHDNGDVSSLSM